MKWNAARSSMERSVPRHRGPLRPGVDLLGRLPGARRAAGSPLEPSISTSSPSTSVVHEARDRDDARDAHLPGHDGRVAEQAAPLHQDPGGGREEQRPARVGPLGHQDPAAQVAGLARVPDQPDRGPDHARAAADPRQPPPARSLAVRTRRGGGRHQRRQVHLGGRPPGLEPLGRRRARLVVANSARRLDQGPEVPAKPRCRPPSRRPPRGEPEDVPGLVQAPGPAPGRGRSPGRCGGPRRRRGSARSAGSPGPGSGPGPGPGPVEQRAVEGRQAARWTRSSAPARISHSSRSRDASGSTWRPAASRSGWWRPGTPGPRTASPSPASARWRSGRRTGGR
jgi:hypothetical protein